MASSDITLYNKLPLDPAKKQCRILNLLPGEGDEQICAELHVQDLINASQGYACTSYVWGDASITKAIQIQDEKLEVTANLINCLYHLRHPENTIALWIDAICINQKDLDEKSQQVGMMNEIYSGCSAVYIWLGAPIYPALVKEDPFAFIRHFADNKHYHDLPGFDKDEGGQVVFRENEEFLALWESFLLISKSTWWTRAWTVQETVLPKNSIVLYGNWKTTFETITRARRRRNMHIDSTSKCCQEGLKAFSGPRRRIFDMFLFEVEWVENLRNFHHPLQDPVILQELEQTGDKISTKAFHEIVQTFSARECKDPRDKVYSLLAMAKGEAFDTYRPNYRATIVECYTDMFVRMLMETGNDYRCLMGLAFGPHASGLPSWVRDFSQVIHISRVASQLRRLLVFPLFNAANGRIGEMKVQNGRELHVIGMHADSITAVGPAIMSVHNGRESLRTPLAQWTKLCEEAIQSTDKAVVRNTLARTMCVTVNNDPFAVQNDVLKWRRMKESDLPNDSEWQQFIDGDIWALERNYEGGLEMGVTGRSLYSTRAGKLGLCNPKGQPGDEVWVLFGSKVPFVLRRVATGRENSYQFIGDCFLEGAMDGEIVKDGVEGERIILV